MRKFLFIVIFALIATVASAQEKQAPKASDKPIEKASEKTAPPEIVIPAEDVKKLKAASDAAELAALRFQNLSLQIQNAQIQLKQLQEAAERARDESVAAENRAKIKAGAPGELVGEYSKIEPQKDGSVKVKRTPKTEAPKQ